MRTWVVLIALALLTSLGLAQPAAGKREVSGTVVDVDGKPIANAAVAVEGGTSTTTGADGAFKQSVPTTNLTINVTANGFTERKVMVIGAKTALSMQLVLAPPATAPPAPTPTRTIGGVVQDGNRAPIANATVRISGTQLTATTDVDGTFSIPNAPTSDVTLDLEVAGQ